MEWKCLTFWFFNLDQAIVTFLMRVFIGRHVRREDSSQSKQVRLSSLGLCGVSLRSRHNLLATEHGEMCGFTTLSCSFLSALILFVQHFADPYLICAHLNGGSSFGGYLGAQPVHCQMQNPCCTLCDARTLARNLDRGISGKFTSFAPVAA